MKKFNFFPVLLVALFMILGLTANAQTYVPSLKALNRIEGELVNLEKTYPQSNLSAPATQGNAAFTLHSMKVAVGESMLVPLKSGSSVELVLASTFGRIDAGGNADRQAIISEVEFFYRTLLKF